METNMSETAADRPTPYEPGPGNLLNDGVRREIADLNLLYLDHAMDPEDGQDEWFGVPPPALAVLAGASPDARMRTASSPVVLFQMVLPPDPLASERCGRGIADGARAARSGRDGRADVRRSFGLVALGVARRMLQGSPLASRIAFGLAPETSLRLSSLTPSESFALACFPGLIRPRWSGHERYWRALAAAASDPLEGRLDWAFRAGLCLMSWCERQRTPQVEVPVRRPPRTGHRREPSGGSGVPC
jgi:hypothetical protein